LYRLLSLLAEGLPLIADEDLEPTLESVRQDAELRARLFAALTRLVALSGIE